MPVAHVLARLTPLEQDAVRLVYFEGRSQAEAARLLAVERAVIASALAAAFHSVARWVFDDEAEGGIR